MSSTSSILRRSANRYGEHSKPIFPCVPRRKNPLTSNGFKDATSDLKQINEWWTKHPNANIGLPTGKQSGLVAVDIDPRHNGEISFEQLVSKHGPFPDTATQETGRRDGGRHYFYGYPADATVGTFTLAPGIDVRSDGAYVLLPPSLHPDTGLSYRWDGVEGAWALLHPAPLPAWIVDAASQNQDADENQHRVDFVLPEVIPDGAKHDSIVSLAGWLRDRNTPIASAYAACRELVFESPVSDADIKHEVEDVYKRYAPDGRTQLFLYNAREVLQTEIVFIASSRKDCDSLAGHGFIGTYITQWRRVFGPYFTGRTVVLVPENTPAGRKHGSDIGYCVREYADAVILLELEDAKDISSWFEAGHSEVELCAFVEAQLES